MTAQPGQRGSTDKVGRALQLAKTATGRRKLADAGLSRLRSRFGVRPTPYQHLENVTGLPNMVSRQAVRAITTLGLPDLIASGVTNITVLADKVEVDPGALRRVAHHLVKLNVFASPAPGTITLTEVGELLRSGHPDGRDLNFQLGAASPRLEAALGNLLYSVRTGGPAYAHVHGAEMWDQMAKDPLLTASFDAMMVEHARTLGPGFVELFDWQGISQVADIGGGTGELLAQLLRRFPDMRGIVLEFADAVDRARTNLESSGFRDRCTVVRGNFLEEIPGGADAYILSWILHDWNDEQAKLILENTRAALGTRGRVLVVEKLFDVTEDTDLDIRMLVFYGGRERTRGELAALSRNAGLRPTSWSDIGSGFWVMECVAD
jgi:2,7-dihydroxy-5-methyl-1-naphthoate 7-O-methyltransferase